MALRAGTLTAVERLPALTGRPPRAFDALVWVRGQRPVIAGATPSENAVHRPPTPTHDGPYPPAHDVRRERESVLLTPLRGSDSLASRMPAGACAAP